MYELARRPRVWRKYISICTHIAALEVIHRYISRIEFEGWEGRF
jgi:hypothetical protein